MASLADLTQHQLREFEDVREAWKGLKGHVQLSTLSALIDLYKQYGNLPLCTAIRVMLWLDWNRLIDLQATANIVKKYGTDRVLKALETMGAKKWHSPESLEKYLSGKMTDARGAGMNGVHSAQLAEDPLEYCRANGLHTQRSAVDWLIGNRHRAEAFEEFFDRAGYHPTFKYNNKPMPLFRLKGEYQ